MPEGRPNLRRHERSRTLQVTLDGICGPIGERADRTGRVLAGVLGESACAGNENVRHVPGLGFPDNWDMINPEPSLKEFKKFEAVRIEALNHALRGLPQTASASISAGAAGTVRTPPTSRCKTSSI